MCVSGSCYAYSYSTHSIKFEINAGKENCVDFSTGQEPMVYKGKNGHLMVVSELLIQHDFYTVKDFCDNGTQDTFNI